MCICAHVLHLLLGVGDYFWQKERQGCCLCLLYFESGWECMWVYVCVYAHTHTVTLHRWGTRCEPRSRDQTPEGPKNPDGLNLGIYVFVYVYVYARRRDEKRVHLENSKQNYYIISFWAIIKAIFTSQPKEIPSNNANFLTSSNRECVLRFHTIFFRFHTTPYCSLQNVILEVKHDDCSYYYKEWFSTLD